MSMYKDIKYRLHLRSSFITPFHSDTLMGSLAWLMVQHYGEESLMKWIDACRLHPPFVMSNAFPLDLWPKLMVPHIKRDENLKTKSEQMKDIREAKKYKNRLWLTLKEFNAIRNGYQVEWESIPQDIQSYSRLHPIIDRITGSSLQKDGLYEIQEHYVEYMTLYVRYFDLSYIPIVESLLELLGEIGFGAKKSSGKGLFTVENKGDASAIFKANEYSNGFAVLSHAVPSSQDAIEGFYKLSAKYGKIGEKMTDGPFKYPLLMMLAGSCFYSNEQPLYYGRMIEGIAPSHLNVVQFSFGLTIPIFMQENGVADGDY